MEVWLVSAVTVIAVAECRIPRSLVMGAVTAVAECRTPLSWFVGVVTVQYELSALSLPCFKDVPCGRQKGGMLIERLCCVSVWL